MYDNSKAVVSYIMYLLLQMNYPLLWCMCVEMKVSEHKDRSRVSLNFFVACRFQLVILSRSANQMLLQAPFIT